MGVVDRPAGEGPFDHGRSGGYNVAMSEILVLRLQRPLPYLRRPASELQEAVDSVEIHRFSDLFDFSGDAGPEARLPGAGSLLDSGSAAREGEEASFALEAGSYLFRQERILPGFDLRAALREYVRDAWWEGRKTGDRLILRRVREDGKLSVQMLCPTDPS